MASNATAVAEGLAAAQRAQDIADAVNPPSLLDQIFGIPGDIAHSIGGTVDEGLATARDIAQPAADAAKDVADTVLNVVKWIGIALLVVVAIMGLAWIAFAFFGLKTAAVILPKFAVGLGQGAGRALAGG